MKFTFPFLALALLLASCNSKSAGDANSQSNNSAVGASLAGSTKMAETLVVKTDAEFAGLWSGSFEPTELQKKAEAKVMELADKEGLYIDGFEGNAEAALKKIPADLRKCIEKDMIYGGYYVAQPNKISLVIDAFTNGQISGRSICAGNERPVTGTYTSDDKGWSVSLKEPGDDKYDGSFQISMLKGDSVLNGAYTPFDKNLPAKNFSMTRKKFTYNPKAELNYSSTVARWKSAEKNDGEYNEINLNASDHLLTIAEVENQPKATLRAARCAIFARHGYSFKVRDVRNYFEQFEDYFPFTTDVRNQLTEIENKNIELLKRYEAYAVDFYDEYGR